MKLQVLTLIASLFCCSAVVAGEVKPTLVQSYNKDFLEGYRWHVAETVTVIDWPDDNSSKYRVTTTLTFTNDLEIQLNSGEFRSLGAAVDRRDQVMGTLDSSYPAGTELYFERHMGMMSQSFSLHPSHHCLGGRMNSFFSEHGRLTGVEKLPTLLHWEKVIEEVPGFWNFYRERIYVKIWLSDGSTWRLDPSLDIKFLKFWRAGDHFIVSLKPEGTLLINIEARTPLWNQLPLGCDKVKFLGIEEREPTETIDN